MIPLASRFAMNNFVTFEHILSSRQVIGIFHRRNGGISCLVSDENEGFELRDDGFDGDLDSSAFSDGQSVDSRSCGDSVSEKDAQADLVKKHDKLGYDTNVADTGNKAEKWPKVGSTSAMNDETIGENGDGRKTSSFRHVFKKGKEGRIWCRGFGDQRSKEEMFSFCISVNKGKEPVNVGGAERGKKNKGTSRMEVDSDNNNSRMINNVGSGKKINKKDGTSSENRFAMLSEEIEIKENLEWDYLKAKIDEACENGIYISMQEKKEWPGEIAHSHNVVSSESRVKAKSMVKSVMIEQGLSENQAFGKIYDQIFRDELERIKDMILKKLLVEAELFVKTGQIFTKHELDTWPDEKIEFYKVSIGAAAYEKILHQIRISNNANIDEEVAKDQSGTA
ncbi:hypothetical protein Tco_0151686 [Tanacetum coccineum]